MNSLVAPIPAFTSLDPAIASDASAPSRRFLRRITFYFLWIFVFAIPCENALIIPGIGTISRFVGICTLAVGLLAVLDAGYLRELKIQHFWMILFVAWICLTYFWSSDPSRTYGAIVTFPQLLCMVWLIWEFAQTRKEQILLLNAYALGASVSSIATILVFASGNGTPNERYAGFNFNAGDLALIIALSVPISLYLAFHEGRKFSSLFYVAQGGLAIFAICLTASRGALIACGASALLIPFLFRQLNFRQKTISVLLLFLAGVASSIYLPQSSWSRLATIGSEVRSGTLNERTLIWQVGWELFQQSPFVGVGARAYAPAADRQLGLSTQGEALAGEVSSDLVAHNTFFSVLVEQGVIGFGLFLALLLLLIAAVWQLPVLERTFWVVLFLTWAIGAANLTWEDRKPTWFLFGLLIAAAAPRMALFRRQVASTPFQFSGDKLRRA